MTLTAALIASLPHSRAQAILKELRSLPPDQAEALNRRWSFWARPAQIPPETNWHVWAFIAGRGAGKTRSGAEWVREKVKRGCGRIALVAPTAGDGRDVMVEGESGLESVCWTQDKTRTGEAMGRPKYEPSKRRVTWENGAQAFLYSAEEPERLRGPQHDAAWADEMASWKYRQETWDQLQFGLRLGNHPQICLTTTPKPFRLLQDILADPGNHITRGSTFDNASNLAPGFLEIVRKKYEGTNLGRQELYAEILEAVEGALWTPDMLTQARDKAALPRVRTVVGVDPSGGAGERGIVAASSEGDGHFAILADYSGKMTAEQYGRRAVQCAEDFDADAIVVETNYGGDMAEQIIKACNPSARIIKVTATRGKHVRAEPVAALYEQGRVRHAAGLALLEDQMQQMTTAGWEGDGASPDRLDAAVWAITELMNGGGYNILAAMGKSL